MIHNRHTILLACLMSMTTMPLCAQQQQTLCDFESEDSYKAVGVYDTWADSPFRTGRLKGNAAVVDNFLSNDNTNNSSSILGVQRSRYGSNTFGALVSLKEPFALTKTERYVHVNIWSPRSANVMLIGLGRRDDRPWQSDKTEQFWSIPSSQVQAGEWTDVVFPMSGANGITISHLLVVVDRSSAHSLADDYVAYIDNMVLSSSSKPSFSSAIYPINYETTTSHTRTDRYLNNVSLTSTDGTQTVAISQNTDKHLYFGKTATTLLAKAGSNMSVSFGWTGEWMCGYVYVDKDNDGSFDVDYTASGVTNMRDLMAYSYYKGKASDGKSVSSKADPGVNPPSFALPTTLAPGFYRMRLKVDWDCVDPGGNTDASNKITSNGGSIVDVRLNVHADNVGLYRGTEDNGGGLNGDLLMGDGSAMTGKTTPFATAFDIVAEPAEGFELDYVKIRHGYNLGGKSVVNGNLQWEETIVDAAQFAGGRYTVPASVVDGDLRFVPYFKSKQPTSVTLTITQAGWGTLILPFGSQLPDGLHAYECRGEGDNGRMEYLQVASLAANMPYVVSGTAGDYLFKGISTASDDTYSNGYMTGVFVATQAPVGSYVLQNHADDGLAFYRVYDTPEVTVPPYKCYINRLEGQMSRIALPDVVNGITVAGYGGADRADIYSAAGVLLQRQADVDKALETLPRGVYIIKTGKNTKTIAR